MSKVLKTLESQTATSNIWRVIQIQPIIDIDSSHVCALAMLLSTVFYQNRLDRARLEWHLQLKKMLIGNWLSISCERARHCDPINEDPVPHALARTHTQRNVNLIIWWLPLSAAVRTRARREKNARVVILAEEVFWSERSVAAAFLVVFSLSRSLSRLSVIRSEVNVT